MRVVDLFNSYFDAGAKELLQSISVKQGKKMDSPESAKDIKKFINSFKAWYSFCPKIMPALNVFYVWIRCVAHHLTSKYYVVSMEKSMHEWWLVLFWVFGTYGNLLVSLSCTFHTNSKQVLNFLFSFICHFFFFCSTDGVYKPADTLYHMLTTNRPTFAWDFLFSLFSLKHNLFGHS